MRHFVAFAYDNGFGHAVVDMAKPFPKWTDADIAAVQADVMAGHSWGNIAIINVLPMEDVEE